MKLEVAMLVAGSETPAEDSTTGAVRCVIVLPDNSRRRAVLKRGTPGQITAEAFSALLLRAWALPVPEPFLVDERGAMSFASADTGYPNLKQRIGLPAISAGPAHDAAVRIAIELACCLPTAPLAAAIDEVIDNRDRNLGNILWDGSDESWIDHAFALGQGAHMDDLNKLCGMVLATQHEERFSRGAIAHGLLLDRLVASVVETTVSGTPLGSAALAPFVAARLVALGGRLGARFPRPADLLSNP